MSVDSERERERERERKTVVQLILGSFFIRSENFFTERIEQRVCRDKTRREETREREMVLIGSYYVMYSILFV